MTNEDYSGLYRDEGFGWSAPRVDCVIELDDSSWLSRLVNTETLGRIGQYPALEGRSDEWLIYQRLYGVLVESGSELDPNTQARLRNLIGVMRLAMFPNLNPMEQESLLGLSRATSFDMSAVQYDVDPEAIEDIRWLWRTFGLRVPTVEESRPQFGNNSTALFGPLREPQA